MNRKRKVFGFLPVLLVAAALLTVKPYLVYADWESSVSTGDLSGIPPYNGSAIAILNNNMPNFYVGEITAEPYVRFSSLDALGRTGSGMACLGIETMPTEPRGEIGDIRPSGWQTVRYDDLIEDRYLFNRSHVIGYQLCGDNATPEHLFTGTRYLNSESMLYFENLVAAYLNSHVGGHVIYRVTPVYEGDNLVASGVRMEAFSVEDFGAGLCFHIFAYNVQPGIWIDYATGESAEDPAYGPETVIGAPQIWQEQQAGTAGGFIIMDDGLSGSDEVRESPQIQETSQADPAEGIPRQVTYILNTNTKKFHYPDCASVQDMKEKNKREFTGTREEAIAQGYVPCGRCNP